MADVRPGGSVCGDRDGAKRKWRGRSRGQLFLVTALVIAVLLVSLALLLNTAIYTENLATRSADPGSANAISYQRDAVEGVGGVTGHVNANHAESNATLHAALNDSVRAWDDASARHAAADARSVGVSVASATNGTQVVQNDTRNFSAADGTLNWTLAGGIDDDRGARAFSMSVRRDDLASGPPGVPSVSDLAGAFSVTVTDDDETWRVYVYRNASEVQVAVDDGSMDTDADCSVPPTNGTVTVDLTAGTVGGRACDALSVFSAVDEDFDLAYRNGNAVNGTYSVALNETYGSGLLDPAIAAYHDRSSGASPYVAPAIYAVEVDLTVESQRVYYRTAVRVAPGETDD